MRVLLTEVSRFTQPAGICRVAANHALALVEHDLVDEVHLVIAPWQVAYYRMLLNDADLARLHLHVAENVRNTSFSRNSWSTTQLPRLARSLGADLVHLAYPVPVSRSAFDCPLVVTLHDLFPYDAPRSFGFPNYLVNRIILRYCLHNVDGIVCVSEFTRRRLQDLFPARSAKVPVSVVPNFVRFNDELPKRPAFAERLDARPFLLMVAQHRSNKNLDLLLRSYGQLRDRDKIEHALILIGAEGPETPTLNHLVRSMGLEACVTFVNRVTDGELQWSYRHCAALINCSSVEGFCLPVAEALANSARVVCSDIPVLRETGGERCIYFSLNRNPVTNLAAAITSALQSSARPEIGGPRFSEAGAAAEYSRLYAEVLCMLPEIEPGALDNVQRGA